MKRKGGVEWDSDDEFTGCASVVVELGAWSITAGVSGALVPDVAIPAAHRCFTDGDAASLPAPGPFGQGGGKAAKEGGAAGRATTRTFGHTALGLGGDGYTVGDVWMRGGGEGAGTWTLSPDAAADAVVYAAEDAMGGRIGDRPVVLVDPPGVTEAARERLVAAVFDSGAPALGVVGDAACATFALGVDRGVVLDVGHRGTRCSVVVDGYTLRRCSEDLPFGAVHAVRNWMDLVADTAPGRPAPSHAKPGTATDSLGTQVPTQPLSQEPPRTDPACPVLSPFHVLRRSLKGVVKTFYVGDARLSREEAAELARRVGFHPSFHACATARAYHRTMATLGEPAAECALPPQTAYELPDGQVLSVTDHHRSALGGVWFTGASTQGGVRHRPAVAVQELIKRCAAKAEPAVIPALYENVVVKGGPSGQPGFRGRLEDELEKILPPNFTARVRRGSERAAEAGDVYPEHASWCGAAIYAHTAASACDLISRAQWEEQGGRVLAARLSRM